MPSLSTQKEQETYLSPTMGAKECSHTVGNLSNFQPSSPVIIHRQAKRDVVKNTAIPPYCHEMAGRSLPIDHGVSEDFYDGPHSSDNESSATLATRSG